MSYLKGRLKIKESVAIFTNTCQRTVLYYAHSSLFAAPTNLRCSSSRQLEARGSLTKCTCRLRRLRQTCRVCACRSINSTRKSVECSIHERSASFSTGYKLIVYGVCVCIGGGIINTSTLTQLIELRKDGQPSCCGGNALDFVGCIRGFNHYGDSERTEWNRGTCNVTAVANVRYALFSSP